VIVYQSLWWLVQSRFAETRFAEKPTLTPTLTLNPNTNPNP